MKRDREQDGTAVEVAGDDCSRQEDEWWSPPNGEQTDEGSPGAPAQQPPTQLPKTPNSSDQWGTPELLYSALLAGLGIQEFCLDPATCEPQLIPSKVYYTGSPLDGLLEPWDGQYIWCNPPYSKSGPWVDKAIREHRAAPEKRIVLLIPNAPDTAAFGRMLDSGPTVLEIVRRLKFIDLSGRGRSYGARQPSVLCIWGATNDEIAAVQAALSRNGYGTRKRA
jgi:hypothetical protein